MKRRLACGLAILVCGLPAAGLAGDGAYKAPRNGFGQPDLGGAWSNATLTPQVRPALYGTRRVQTPEEIAIRAERYRRRYGDGIPLNPMALANNWTPLAKEIQEVHDHGQHTSNRYGSDQRSARAGSRSSRWSSNAPKPLPDADYWERERQRLEREGRLAKPRNHSDGGSSGELPDVQ